MRHPFYVISHERSGTHFLINSILKNTNARGKKFLDHYNIGEWFGPYTHKDSQAQHIRKFFSRRVFFGYRHSVIKSHADKDLFCAYYKPFPVIYITRDPRDVMVSLFHHQRHKTTREYLENHNPQLRCHAYDTIGEFLKAPISSYLRHCYSLKGESGNVVQRWARHIQGWQGYWGEIFFVRFEDLKRDFVATMTKVAAFLDISLKADIAPVGLHDMPSIMPRKGIVGDWQNHFSSQDEAFLKKEIESQGLIWTSMIDNK